MNKKLFKNLAGYYLCRLRRFGLDYGLRYRQLYQIIKDKKPQNIMEIGVFNGKNAIRMLNINPDIKVNYYGFDLFEDLTSKDFEREVAIQPLSLKNVKNKLTEKTKANINLFKGDTTKLAKQDLTELPKMDLIFIDGGHSIETQWNDWLLVKDLMHARTIVIVDDYWNLPNSGCKFMLNKLDKQQYDVEALPVKDYYMKDWGILTTQFLKITLR